MSWTGFKKAVTRAGQSVAVKTVDKAVDGEFEQQDRCYKMLKTSGLNLQKSIRDYSNTLLQLTASQVNIAEIVSNLRQDTNPSQNSNVEIYYSQVVKEINEETIKSIDRPFKETVMDPVNKFANYFIDIDEAIKKRAHKKIDYEQCRAKVRKLIDKPPKDANKLPIAQKELQTAKKIYEEINEQLKNELPQLIALRVPFLEPSFESVVKFQLRFVTDAYSRLAHLQQYLDPKLREEYAGGLLDGQIDDMIAQMNQLGIAQINKKSTMYERPEGIENRRIWIDGCFDFAHHGHAGAILQARQLGKELYVGVHSDEEILYNKGPPVMHLDERITAVSACKWSTRVIPSAPYVTSLDVMDEYNCKYVVHGDDITTDANGEDCYQICKDMGRFVVVKRTPNISTTDLVGRMLLLSKSHMFPKLDKSGSCALFNEDNLIRFKQYSTDETGLKPRNAVFVKYNEHLDQIVIPSDEIQDKLKKIVYIDGGFDLFHPGHSELLKILHARATELNAAVVVGLHEDVVINQYKGMNYPIMNLLERSLCVLQCRYVDAVVLGAPYKPTVEFLKELPGKVIKVFHGPTELETDDVYSATSDLYEEIGPHKYDEMNTAFIVDRVLQNKAAFEERQKRKGWKAEKERELKQKEVNNSNSNSNSNS